MKPLMDVRRRKWDRKPVFENQEMHDHLAISFVLQKEGAGACVDNLLEPNGTHSTSMQGASSYKDYLK